ncbi:hypothetical protein MKW94_022545, partial [Papaver nudicaule]|nr:hypothetical protein [Papaver nudicaule]
MGKSKAKKKCPGTFRSSLEQTVDIAANVKVKIKDYPKHLEEMKKCPFWSFYQPFHEGRINRNDMKKRQKGLEVILNSFNPVKEVFEIGGKEFKSTAEQLAVIFGLQRIKLGEEEEGFTNMMLKKDIIDSLYATAGDVNKPQDFVKLLVLYLCVEIFFPNQGGGKLPSIFLKYVFAMDQVSWPDLIHSYLLQGLKETKKPYKSVKGCAVYILFWFAEITHLIRKYEGEQGKTKPRFARWNTRVLARKIGNEGMTTLRQDLTGSFINPLDEGERSLITPIEICQANSDRVRDREIDGEQELSPDRDAAGYLDDL